MTNNIDKRSGIFFNAFADTFDTLYEKQRGPIMRTIDYYFRSDIEKRFTKTFEVFGQLHDETILDIGCGSGIYLKYALDKGAKMVTGIDPAQRMLDISKGRLKSYSTETDYKLIYGNFPENKLEEKYDHIIVMGVMDYVNNSVVFLSALKTLFTKSIAISFPSFHWFRTPIRKIRYKLRNCPVYFYDKEKIASLLKSSGFTNFEIYKIPGAGMDYHIIIYP